MTIVGIDLGTTNSLISVWDSEKAVIIPNALGDRLTPSIVGVDDSGEILIGKAAKERLITHPHKTAAVFKRYMGSEKTFKLGEHVFRPEELASLVLRSLKEDAEIFLGETVTEAVISVPAYFNDTQRKATRSAGQLAGLTVERLINEPTAAAIAYGLHQKKDDATILVFDLGGGTFDVSILEFFAGVMEVRATAGDSFLGGEDFIQTIVKAFARNNGIEKSQLDPFDQNRLIQKAEDAKRQLSSQSSTTIRMPVQGRNAEWRLTREAFEEMAVPLIKRIRLPVERALLDSAIQSKAIDECVLVGGATRMPVIRKLVARMFGRFPSLQINPDEAVALGAAVQAGLKTRDKALKEVVFTDVCPFSLGIEVVLHREDLGYSYGNFAPVLERGVVIPVSKEERFYTLYDDQEKIEVVIYQGESRRVKDNIKLGKLTVPVPPAPAGNEAVDVRFTYSVDGILEVGVGVVSTGIEKSIVIEESPGVLTPEQITERLEALAELKIHPREKLENRTLLARGERLYESRLKEDRRLIADAIMEFECAIEKQESKAITNSRMALERLLQQIENEETVI